MAQRTTVVMVDDLDGTESDDVQTVGFGLDGVTYEIDLSADNAKELRESLADFITNGRKIGKFGKPLVRVAGGVGGSGRSKEQLQAIRDWAKANGHAVSDRGRIPADVLAEFDAAH